jgi:hypothetical protein
MVVSTAMADDTNILVFSRPTPFGDRMAFGICGVGALAPLLYFWGLNDFAIPDFEQLSHTEIGLLTVWLMAGVSLLAVALWGGTLTVTIDRKARQLHEVAKVGPFKAIDKTFAFKELGDPVLHEEARRFIVEVPVKGRVAVQIGVYAGRREAEAALGAVVKALDVAEPLAEPVSPAAINPLKSGSLLSHGPVGPLNL